MVAIFLCATVSVVFATSFSDVPANHRHAQAITALSEDGIIRGFPDGTFQPSGNVTRAELAAIICRKFGFGGSFSQVDTIFTDVPSTHWASGYIAIASELGIILGMGDGTFVPNANVTYEQAITMIVRALGYDSLAQANGGFPNGYLSVGNELGLNYNVDGIVGSLANRGTIAQIIYNSVSVAASNIVGIWELESMDIEGTTVLTEEFGNLFPAGIPYLWFNDDNTIEKFNFIIEYDIDNDTFVSVVEFAIYEIDGNSVSVTDSEGNIMLLLLIGDVLIWQEDGFAMTFNRLPIYVN